MVTPRYNDPRHDVTPRHGDQGHGDPSYGGHGNEEPLA
jgi:hypothetical protein